AARGGLDQAEQSAPRRRFAAARLADEAERGALGDVERDPVDGLHGADGALEKAASHGEMDLEIADLEQGLCRHEASDTTAWASPGLSTWQRTTWRAPSPGISRS